MGRWYQTASPPGGEFVDFSETTDKGGGAQAPTALSLLGDKQVLPNDWGRHQQKLQEVDSQVNEITARMQADPRQAHRYIPDIQSLKQRIQQDVQAGEWAAMFERKRMVDENKKGLEELRKKDPALAYMAEQAVDIPELGFDQETKTFGKPTFPMVETYSPENIRAWENSLKTSVKDRILSKIDDVKKISPMQSIMTLGQTVGVTRDDVLEAAIGSVDPKALLAADARRRLTERMTGEQSGIKEQEFYTRDENGKIQLNLDTEWGRRINSLAQALEREDFKGQRLNVTDQQKLLAAKEGSAKRLAAYRRSLTQPEPTEWYPKLQKLFEGEGYNAEGSTDELKIDNSLAGRKIGSAGIISRIEKKHGEAPEVVYHEVVQTALGKEVEERRQKLDFDLLRNALDAKTLKQLEKDLKEKGGWTPEGVIGMDASKDRLKPSDVKTSAKFEFSRSRGSAKNSLIYRKPTAEQMERMLGMTEEERVNALVEQAQQMIEDAQDDVRDEFQYE